MALGPAEELDVALDDAVLDPAGHGVGARPPRDDEVGHVDALGQRRGRVVRGRGRARVARGRVRRRHDLNG